MSKFDEVRFACTISMAYDSIEKFQLQPSTQMKIKHYVRTALSNAIEKRTEFSYSRCGRAIVAMLRSDMYSQHIGVNGDAAGLIDLIDLYFSGRTEIDGDDLFEYAKTIEQKRHLWVNNALRDAASFCRYRPTIPRLMLCLLSKELREKDSTLNARMLTGITRNIFRSVIGYSPSGVWNPEKEGKAVLSIATGKRYVFDYLASYFSVRSIEHWMMFLR